MNDPTAHLIYAALWLSFGAGHSLLAGDVLKRPFGARYRLAYNAIATLHLLAIYALGHWLFADAAPLDLPEWLRVPMWALHLVGWGLLLYGATGYDLGRLSGLRQLETARHHRVEPDDEPLRVDGLHRYVRHPLYAAGFPILWSVAVDQMHLATAIWGSLYLVIGARVEEGRLLRLYGASYRDYRRRVPALVPWKGAAIPAGWTPGPVGGDG